MSGSSSRHPWAALFRLPNLPSAPGDALAGATASFLAVPCPADVGIRLVAAAAAALFLYMAGLADNDLVGAEADKTNAPERPIPAGLLSVRQVSAARAVCFLLAAGTGAAARLPMAWWIDAAALSLLILAYNRFKDRGRAFGLVAMGLCRGMSAACGAAAMSASGAFRPASLLPLPVVPVVVAWTAYIAAVTLLAADEHKADKPVSAGFLLPALIPLLPLALFGFRALGTTRGAVLCCGCLMTAAMWMLAVVPLRRPHTPAARRRAVGTVIGALMYLQAGVALMIPLYTTVVVFLVCFAARRVIRRLAPAVSGS